jgi:tRNA U54 and U55 pseudouridine synthase Pus10
MVARCAFHGRGKVEDNFVLGSSFTPSLENLISKINSKFRFGLGESLKAVIEGEFGA